MDNLADNQQAFVAPNVPLEEEEDQAFVAPNAPLEAEEDRAIAGPEVAQATGEEPDTRRCTQNCWGRLLEFALFGRSTEVQPSGAAQDLDVGLESKYIEPEIHPLEVHGSLLEIEDVKVWSQSFAIASQLIFLLLAALWVCRRRSQLNELDEEQELVGANAFLMPKGDDTIRILGLEKTCVVLSVHAATYYLKAHGEKPFHGLMNTDTIRLDGTEFGWVFVVRVNA
jgi:hypothetical protein